MDTMKTTGRAKKGENIVFITKKEMGQGLIEYALILAFVAIVVVAVLMLVAPAIGEVFSTINASLSAA
jgi:pilus assembly protein Flp/PilA